MQKWVNFLRGSVCLEISGAFPERFLNLCSVERLGFWGLERREKGVLRVSVALWDVPRARALAARAGCEAARVSGRGLPLFLFSFRRRYGLLCGLALSILTAVFLSQFVLVIKVTGNETLPDSVILTELEAQGLSFGAYGPAVDERAVANRVLEALPGLSFLSINRSGIYAEVVVREADPEPELRDESTPTDVVAARDGIIMDVNALSGNTVVETGAAVLAGETLISHYLEFEPAEWSDGATFTMTTHARGEVWALTERRFSAKMPLETSLEPSEGEETVRYALRIGKNTLKFYQNSSNSGLNCAKIKKTWDLTLPGGIVLPVAWEQERLTPYSASGQALSAESAEAYLKERLLARLEAVLGEGQILGKSWDVAEEDGALTVTLSASCLENIAKEQAAAEE